MPEKKNMGEIPKSVLNVTESRTIRAQNKTKPNPFKNPILEAEKR